MENKPTCCSIYTRKPSFCTGTNPGVSDRLYHAQKLAVALKELSFDAFGRQIPHATKYEPLVLING